jgi:uncharacterized protein (DUF697 family)
MKNFEIARDEFEADAGEFESDSFEFEADQQFEIESPLDEVEEMELAAELLEISSEQELDQFLGKLFKRAWKGIRKVGSFVGKIARPLGGMLKGIAKKALPFVGGALGSFIPIPGVGTAIGTAVGSAASKLLEVDMEGMGPGDQEFELARRFVRLASTAAVRAANTSPADEEFEIAGDSQAAAKSAAVAAVQSAARQLGGRPPSRRHRKLSGHWVRRGNRILVIGA